MRQGFLADRYGSAQIALSIRTCVGRIKNHRVVAKPAITRWLNFLSTVCVGLFKGFLNFFVRNHFFLEYVSSCFGRLFHADYLAVGTSFAFLERCNGFLCHILGVYVGVIILFLYEQ